MMFSRSVSITWWSTVSRASTICCICHTEKEKRTAQITVTNNDGKWRPMMTLRGNSKQPSQCCRCIKQKTLSDTISVLYNMHQAIKCQLCALHWVLITSSTVLSEATRRHAHTHAHAHIHAHGEKYSPSEYQLRAMDQSDLRWAHLPLCSWSPWRQKWKGSLPPGLTACRSQSADTGSAGCCSAGLDLHPATAGPASLSRLNNNTNQQVFVAKCQTHYTTPCESANQQVFVAKCQTHYTTPCESANQQVFVVKWLSKSTGLCCQVSQQINRSLLPNVKLTTLHLVSRQINRSLVSSVNIKVSPVKNYKKQTNKQHSRNTIPLFKGEH